MCIEELCGSAISQRVSDESSYSSTAIGAWLSAAAWSKRMPFGRPVVPLV